MKNPLKFIQEVKQEAFRVTWPTGKETLQGTLMVVAMAIVASLFFLLLDQFLKFFLELILKISIWKIGILFNRTQASKIKLLN